MLNKKKQPRAETTLLKKKKKLSWKSQYHLSRIIIEVQYYNIENPEMEIKKYPVQLKTWLTSGWSMSSVNFTEMSSLYCMQMWP